MRRITTPILALGLAVASPGCAAFGRVPRGEERARMHTSPHRSGARSGPQ